MSDPELPENYAVNKIMDILTSMDGMNNCMALGILECVKQMIFEMMQDKEDYWEETDE